MVIRFLPDKASFLSGFVVVLFSLANGLIIHEKYHFSILNEYFHLFHDIHLAPTSHPIYNE